MRALVVSLLTLTALGIVSSCGDVDLCDDDADCAEDQRCVRDAARDAKLCAPACAPDTPCDGGYACVAVDGVDEGVCLDVRDDRALGSSCTEDRECDSGACAGEAGELVCVATCAVGVACDDGLLCALDGLRFVCVEPTDTLDNGAPCEDSRACASGLCIVTPGASEATCADGCVDAGDCGDDVCVRLELGARACLEALEDGAPCSSHEVCAGGFCVEDRDGTAKCASACEAGACADGFFCVDDEEGNDVCMPRLDDRPAGDTCEVDRECASGLCRHFVAEQDLGTLCADPCAATEPVCADGLVCWDGDDVDVCGPTP